MIRRSPRRWNFDQMKGKIFQRPNQRQETLLWPLGSWQQVEAFTFGGSPLPYGQLSHLTYHVNYEVRVT